MKILKYITLMTILAIFAFTSCKKDSNIVGVKSSQNETTQKLIDFKNSLNSKNGVTLSFESANWYMEGLLNFERANNDHNFNELTHYYDTISNNFTGTSINYNELNNLYITFNNILDKHIESTPNSKFDLIDLNFINSNNEIIIVMISSIGVENTKYIYPQFTSTDYWKWGWNLGKCDGTLVGQDAADKLEYTFNHPTNPNLLPGYFINVEMKTVYPQNYPDPNYPGAFYKFMLFWTGGAGSGPNNNLYEPCIAPSELNYYVSKFDYIRIQNCPSGKVFKNVHVVDTSTGGLTSWNRAHNYQLNYGTFIPNGGGN
jgi:hypothetical protein